MFLFLEGKSVLRILKAQPEDLGIILALQYRAFRSEARLLGNERIPPLMQTLKDLEKEYREGIVLKAVDEVGVIIGSVRAREKGDTLHIAKLMVLPERQGRVSVPSFWWPLKRHARSRAMNSSRAMSA